MNRERGEARLYARPSDSAAPRVPVPAALESVPLASGREGLLAIPPDVDPARPLPLLVSFHGAGSSARRGIERVGALGDEFGVLVFAPQSREPTWDFLRGGYGPDVEALDAALADIFTRFNINAAHVALGGFSDGASYALSLGITNGDFVTHVLAFSPGFADPAALVGNARVFISHGTADEILPIDRTSRFLVPLLRGVGHEVTYTEFDGPHAVPPDILRAAYEWFVEPNPAG
jgi:phospholipase/carboxylesterase